MPEPRIGNERRRVARAARRFDNRNRPAADRLDRSNDIADRVSAAGPQIDAGACSACKQMIQSLEVSGREIADVHVIAYGRAIGRVVIGPENFDVFFLSYRHFQNIWD